MKERISTGKQKTKTKTKQNKDRYDNIEKDQKINKEAKKKNTKML